MASFMFSDSREDPSIEEETTSVDTLVPSSIIGTATGKRLANFEKKSDCVGSINKLQQIAAKEGNDQHNCLQICSDQSENIQQTESSSTMINTK